MCEQGNELYKFSNKTDNIALIIGSQRPRRKDRNHNLYLLSYIFFLMMIEIPNQFLVIKF